jgi:cytochrome c-type biogenesis protein CcsB
MNGTLFTESLMHWIAVVFYAAATVVNAVGIIFEKVGAERKSYLIAIAGLAIHGAAIIFRWVNVGHGPYMVRFEVLSSNAWVAILVFLLFVKIFPRIRVASILVFPAAFFIIALGLFYSAEYRKLPPALNSIWLVLHVLFIKISLATLLIALAFSIFLILKKRTKIQKLSRLPDMETLDIYAYRFAGFGFLFWTNATLSGALWAYQSWGRFWGWDPIETWSLITWIFFGVHLHLRRFLGWRGEKAAWFFILCFILTIISLFFVPLLRSSVHSEYFT